MLGIKVAKPKLHTKVEQTGRKIRDLALGDETWITEEKTGLLVKCVIVHEYHVPGTYTDQIKKQEKDSSKIVWAKQELGNARFRWFALYADAYVDEVLNDISSRDKYFNFYSPKTLYKNPDFTSSLEPKVQVHNPLDLRKLLKVH